MKSYTYERDSKALTRLNVSRTMRMGRFEPASASILILSDATDHKTAVAFHRLFYIRVFWPRMSAFNYAKFTSEEIKAWVAIQRETLRQGDSEIFAMNI